MKRFSPGKLICGIITIILTLSCLLMIAIGISEIRDSASVPSYYLDEEENLYLLKIYSKTEIENIKEEILIKLLKSQLD